MSTCDMQSAKACRQAKKMWNKHQKEHRAKLKRKTAADDPEARASASGRLVLALATAATLWPLSKDAQRKRAWRQPKAQEAQRLRGASFSSVCDVMAKGSRHIRRSCVEMEEMREQFERVLGVRLSDKAGKLSRARSHAWRNGCS